MSYKRLTHLIRQRPWIMSIDDDEPGTLIVTLNEPWCFRVDPTCGVRGFDNFKEVEEGTRKSSVYEELGRKRI
ncbi:hypothetical protein UFOVP1414_44 [uncultured Caudovirales phage]|uniref:Uncharacterized protein n=1 Tax=uncultured Caudovirales phage TaxID=2100421 RepID=A0A6J5SE61_9CAUD|nr:hypothetical protein UFOVP442_33 [uncultured Caudovirales phage]CAB4211899.1 hypothetical protein UFOVP1414_44 [uncultured Caudovirales phage]